MQDEPESNVASDTERNAKDNDLAKHGKRFQAGQPRKPGTNKLVALIIRRGSEHHKRLVDRRALNWLKVLDFSRFLFRLR